MAEVSVSGEHEAEILQGILANLRGGNHEVVTELEVGVGILSTLDTATAAALFHLRGSDKKMLAAVHQVMGAYLEARATPAENLDSRYGTNSEASKAMMNTIRYANALATGDKDKPGLDPNALATAQGLWQRAKNDKDLKIGLRHVSAKVWLNENVREMGEMSHSIIFDDDVVSGVVSKARDVIKQVTDHPFLDNPAMHELLGAAGVLGGHAAGGVPLGSTAVKHAQGIIQHVTHNEQQAQETMGRAMDETLTQILGTSEYSKGDPAWVESALWGMKMGSGDPNLIPDNVALGDVGRAIAAYDVVFNAAEVFDTGVTDLDTRQVALVSKIAAAYDSQEIGELSSIGD